MGGGWGGGCKRKKYLYKGQQLKGKIVSGLFHTFPHFLALSPPGLSLKIKPSLKIRKENQKNKTKLFCTLVVARLSSSEQGQQQQQLKQTSDGKSLSGSCCRAFVSHSGKGTSDMASRDPRDEGSSCRCRSSVAKASARTGVKIAKIGKRGFRGQKLPFPSVPEVGALSQKIPIFLVEPFREPGILDSKRPFLGHWEMGVF